MMTYRKQGLLFAEFYFDEPETNLKADIARYIQRSHAVPRSKSTTFFTRIIDLKRADHELLADLPRDNRYTLRRCEKDDFGYSAPCLASQEAMVTFCDLQDQFAISKRLPTIDKSYYRALSDAGMLQFSFVTTGAHPSISWRSYIVFAGRARILQGGSARFAPGTEGGRTSRANVWNIWQDVLHFQKAGLTYYDLGGWYAGGTDPELLRINDFKSRFGGQVVKQFRCLRALSTKGRLALAARDVVQRWRAAKVSTPEPPSVLTGETCG